MSKTAMAIVRDIRSLIISVEPLLSGGKICQFARAKNSQKMDIVINIQGASNDYMQFAIPNVNIHVPNPSITLPNNGGIDNTQPDLLNFNNLAELIRPMLEGQVKNTFRTNIRSDNGLIRDTDGSWYYNFQLNYWSLQESIKSV
jgi:hypothetical protein